MIIEQRSSSTCEMTVCKGAWGDNFYTKNPNNTKLTTITIRPQFGNRHIKYNKICKFTLSRD